MPKLWVSSERRPRTGRCALTYISPFFYGRSFANDNDLNEQAVRWLEGTANVRRHATTGERPVNRFERDERAVLLPLANHPYRRLGARHAPEPAPRRLPATVKVERRPLSVYTEALQ